MYKIIRWILILVPVLSLLGVAFYVDWRVTLAMLGSAVVVTIIAIVTVAGIYLIRE